MFTRVLVPLDGTSVAEQALTPAIELAARFGAKLLLVRVVDASHLHLFQSSHHELSGDEIQLAIHNERQAAGEYLKAVKQQLANGSLAITTSLMFGVVNQVLLQLVERDDLIVIATRAHGALDQSYAASTAEVLSQHARVPVLVVPPAAFAGNPLENGNRSNRR